MSICAWAAARPRTVTSVSFGLRIVSIMPGTESLTSERAEKGRGQLRGSMSRRRVAEPAAFERAHYVRTVGTLAFPGPKLTPR